MRDSMTAKALNCADTHVKACGNWSHGQIRESWFDEKGNLCVQYEDGSWWHYKETEDGLTWW